MSYASVMVYVDTTGPAENLVRVAAGLADKFKAALIGVSAMAIRPPFVTTGDIAVPEVSERDVKEMMAALDRKEQWFRGFAAAGDRTVEWRTELDYPVETLAREARSADLVVIARGTRAGEAYEALDPGEAILKMGRPTLVVPDGTTALPCNHAIVGWKDTREARRALRDALPLLKAGARVTIVEICEPGDEEGAKAHVADVARYLARHGVTGAPRTVSHHRGSGAAALIALAQDEGGDLLVTGAYGHSRLGEWAFGGMTRDLLATSPFCCLMAH